MPVFQTKEVCDWPEYRALMKRLGVDIRGVFKQEIILQFNEPVKIKHDFYPIKEEKSQA